MFVWPAPPRFQNLLVQRAETPAQDPQCALGLHGLGHEAVDRSNAKGKCRKQWRQTVLPAVEQEPGQVAHALVQASPHCAPCGLSLPGWTQIYEPVQQPAVFRVWPPQEPADQP
mmetsp:Transcript_50248/g.157273  ORF Transcript_50248/g.157273 Transcript_50248/m.157273 type:complete len:114 (-) Transcript_50248:246-587(-)